jgi:hypothetical protein
LRLGTDGRPEQERRVTVSLFGWRTVARSAREARPRPGRDGDRFAALGPVLVGSPMRVRLVAVRLLTGGLLVGLLSGCGAPASGPAGTDPAAGSGPDGAASVAEPDGAASVTEPGDGAAPAAPGDGWNTAVPGDRRGSVAPGNRRDSPTPTADGGSAKTTAPAPAAAAVPEVPRRSADLTGQPLPASAPVRVQVAALGIDMAIEGVGLDGDAMALPANPAVAAWYRYGSAPGSPAGSTVVAAHVDSLIYDLGPFAELAEAPAGTEIVLQTADGVAHRYTIASVDVVEKPAVPWSAVFDRSGPPRLTLVTCGGEFDYDARRYLSNVLVTAEPAP